MAQSTVIGRRADLTLDNFVSYNPPGDTGWDDGYVGWYDRGTAGYVLECFVEFDITSLPAGINITDVQVEADADTGATSPTPVTINLFEQDQTSSNVWISNNRAPWFDDFGTSPGFTPWATLLQSTTGYGDSYPETHTFTSNANLISLVEDWIDSTKDWKDGVILSCNFNTNIYYGHISQVRLVVTYDDPVTGESNKALKQGLEIGLKRGLE